MKTSFAHFKGFGDYAHARAKVRHLRRLGLAVAIIHDGPCWVVVWGRR